MQRGNSSIKRWLKNQLRSGDAGLESVSATVTLNIVLRTAVTDTEPKKRAIRPVYLVVVAILLVLFGISKLPEGEVSYDVSDRELLKMIPQDEPHPGHVSSSTCRECHEHNHDTWFASYHRTMTQKATLETVAGDFDDVHLKFADTDKEFHLFVRDQQPWVRINYEPDLIPGRNLERREFPVVLLTGSHHQQNFWYPAGLARTLAMLPIAYLIDQQRWVPREATFMEQPNDSYKSEIARWNQTCIRCHATYGEPRRDFETHRNAYESQVAEFGISCESCHGPGGNHVRIHRHPDDPAVKDLKDRIVDPSELTHVRSSQVCGACHSINMTRDGQSDWRAHHPGDDLDVLRKVDLGAHLLETDEASEEEVEAAAERKMHADEIGEIEPEELEDEPDQFFWLDSMVRVAGREYTSLLRSACHTNGTMSCVTCHQMHQAKDDTRSRREWANDQLKPAALGDKACIQCHEPEKFVGEIHSHHAAGSSGSRCYNCHMPHTSYALLKAVRSHTIWSPSATETAKYDRPNACNLCHLDKTLGWTAEHLHEWYKQPKPELDAEQREISQAVLHLLKGDAAQRGLTAWGASWPPAVEASGRDWIAPYLALLLDDPYSAVRSMAWQSLATFDEYREFEYDFVAAPDERKAAALAALERWEGPVGTAKRDSVLMDGPKWNRARADAIRAQRDDRPISLLE